MVGASFLLCTGMVLLGHGNHDGPEANALMQATRGLTFTVQSTGNNALDSVDNVGIKVKARGGMKNHVHEPEIPKIFEGEGNACLEGEPVQTPNDCEFLANKNGYTYEGLRPEKPEKGHLRPKGCWANTWKGRTKAYWNAHPIGGLATDRGRKGKAVKPLCQRCNDCQNGGSANGDGSSCSCSCPLGFGGTFCETPLSCSEHHECQNGGSAEGTGSSCSCSCPSGFGGSHCETPLCNNKGVPNSDGTCSCFPQFEGSQCEIAKTCQQQYGTLKNGGCLNGGHRIGSGGHDCPCYCPWEMTYGELCENWHQSPYLGCFKNEHATWGEIGPVGFSTFDYDYELCKNFCRTQRLPNSTSETGDYVGYSYMGIHARGLGGQKCYCSNDPHLTFNGFEYIGQPPYDKMTNDDCSGADSHRNIAIYQVMPTGRFR